MIKAHIRSMKRFASRVKQHLKRWISDVASTMMQKAYLANWTEPNKSAMTELASVCSLHKTELEIVVGLNITGTYVIERTHLPEVVPLG
jgi:hypothetical protein